MENDDSTEADKASSHNYNKFTNFLSPSVYYYNQVNQRQKHAEISGFGQFGNEIGVINRVASGISSVPGLNTGEVSGKVLFTVTQWQELERQMMIFKYIMASIPVPPHLLIPLSTQSNKELRFSSGSDPEPWRCRRTDGKKWRCSRDVAPDQKYCERHAHKNRPRSRKLVEIQSSSSSYQQHGRSTEWLMKTAAGGAGSGGPVSSSSSLQFPQSMNSQCSHSHSHSHSPAVGSKRTHFLPQENLQLDSAGARRQQFIDAWSKAGDGDNNCSLTLSMQCSGGFDGNNNDDRSGGLDSGVADVLRSHSQWSNSNHGLGMGSPPGGPLGEALGLGIASTVIGPRPSTHSGSASDDGASHGHELSFIR